MTRPVLLVLALALAVEAFGIFSRPNPMPREIRPRQRPGALKLCPPGGSSFIDAFNLICPMRRRRSVAAEEDATTTLLKERSRRSSSMERTMEMCCSRGCDFKDILPLCNPFN